MSEQVLPYMPDGGVFAMLLQTGEDHPDCMDNVHNAQRGQWISVRSPGQSELISVLAGLSRCGFHNMANMLKAHKEAAETQKLGCNASVGNTL